MRTAAERIWHVYDSQGHGLAPFQVKVLETLVRCPLLNHTRIVDTHGISSASVYGEYSVRLFIRPICTRCCFTMTHMIQVCGNSHRARMFIINTRPDEIGLRSGSGSSSSLLLCSLELSDTQVNEPQIRALLGTVKKNCEKVVQGFGFWVDRGAPVERRLPTWPPPPPVTPRRTPRSLEVL